MAMNGCLFACQGYETPDAANVALSNRSVELVWPLLLRIRFAAAKADESTGAQNDGKRMACIRT